MCVGRSCWLRCRGPSTRSSGACCPPSSASAVPRHTCTPSLRKCSGCSRRACYRSDTHTRLGLLKQLKELGLKTCVCGTRPDWFESSWWWSGASGTAPACVAQIAADYSCTLHVWVTGTHGRSRAFYRPHIHRTGRQKWESILYSGLHLESLPQFLIRPRNFSFYHSPLHRLPRCPAWSSSEGCVPLLPRCMVQCGGPACPELHQRGEKVQADPRGTRQGRCIAYALPSSLPTPTSDRAWRADRVAVAWTGVLVGRRRGKRRVSGTGPGAASCTSCRPGRSTRYLIRHQPTQHTCTWVCNVLLCVCWCRRPARGGTRRRKPVGARGRGGGKASSGCGTCCSRPSQSGLSRPPACSIPCSSTTCRR